MKKLFQSLSPFTIKNGYASLLIILIMTLGISGCMNRHELTDAEIKRGVDSSEIKGATFCYCAGVQSYIRGDYKSAVKMLRMSAEAGFDRAQGLLGFCYAKGRGVPMSFKEAVKWYKAAAEQGDAEALNRLAWCYEQGEGVEQSNEKAFELNLEAAKKGYHVSQYAVATCYIYGKGVEQSYEQAVKWYTLTVENENPVETYQAWAAYYLGYSYECGRGVEKSEEAALKYYRMALSGGVREASSGVNRLEEQLRN